MFQRSRATGLILVLVSMFGLDAHACFAPPPESTEPHETLVSRTSSIVLVELVSASGGMSWWKTYEFSVVEALKGDFEPVFSVAPPSPYLASDDDYQQHSRQAFWQMEEARAVIGADCLVHASFEIGAAYLLFLDAPFHIHGFERVEDSGDLWLAWVRDQIAGY